MSETGLVKISELVKLSGVKYSTIKYYAEVGILPFIQTQKLKDRKFHLKSSIARLAEIKMLREERRRTISEIVEHFATGTR